MTPPTGPFIVLLDGEQIGNVSSYSYENSPTTSSTSTGGSRGDGRVDMAELKSVSRRLATFCMLAVSGACAAQSSQGRTTSRVESRQHVASTSPSVPPRTDDSRAAVGDASVAYGGPDAQPADRANAAETDVRIPAAGARAAPDEIRAFETRVQRGGRVWWIERRREGDVCVDWRFVGRRGELVLRHDEEVDHGVLRTTFDVQTFAHARFSLLGPRNEWLRPPPGPGGHGAMSFGCGTDYFLARVEGEAVTLYRDAEGLSREGVTIDTSAATETWFLSRAACEASRALPDRRSIERTACTD